MWKNRYKSVLAAVLSAILFSLPAQASPYSEQTLYLAAVIFNRMETPGFGDTAAQVIWASDFLTCTATGRIALPAEEKTFAQALAAVRYAAEGMDPTGGAVWYGGGNTGRTSGSVWYGDGGYLFWGD